MKYLQGKFSVVLGSDLYRENYDRIFRGKKDEEPDKQLDVHVAGALPDDCPDCKKLKPEEP